MRADRSLPDERSAGRDWVVCEATADWDNPLWTNKQHLMSRLGARGTKVLYLDSLGLRRPTVRRTDISRIGRRLRSWRPMARQVSPGVWRDSPLVIPVHSVALVRRINRALLRFRMWRNRRLLGIDAAVLWSFSPSGYRLLDRTWHSAFIYHCVDNIAADPSMDRAQVEADERITAASADVRLASSRPLVERLRGLDGRAVLYWPNPADTARYTQQARAVIGAQPPIVGFVGAIDPKKVDIDLFNAVCAALSGCRFRLIGPVLLDEDAPSTRRLKRLTNLELCGTATRAELPLLLQQFDVAIIPYLVNEYTRFIFPMKVFEYLASGLPVVASPLPSLVGEVEQVSFCNDASAFAAAITDALSNAREQTAVLARRAYAASHSWEGRVEQAEELLRQLRSGHREELAKTVNNSS